VICAIPDHPFSRLDVHFDKIADMIHAINLQGGKVLVHCVAGVSRSATLCIVCEVSLVLVMFHLCLSCFTGVCYVSLMFFYPACELLRFYSLVFIYYLKHDKHK
jgi:hypothetical protein